MMSRICILLLCVGLSCLVGFSAAQEILPGRCPKVTLQANFDASKYVGSWYEIRKYISVFQIGADCTRAMYSAQEDGSIKVENSARFYGTFGSIIGKAVIINSALPANLSVTFPGTGEPGKYWVLETDYEGYAVVFSCTDLGMFYESFAWVLSRTPQLTPEQEALAAAVMVRNKVDQSFLVETNQKNCNGYVNPTTPALPPKSF